MYCSIRPANTFQQLSVHLTVDKTIQPKRLVTTSILNNGLTYLKKYADVTLFARVPRFVFRLETARSRHKKISATTIPICALNAIDKPNKT
jgi:hypothetical protein